MKTLTKKISNNEYLEVKINTDEYFSITGTTYEKLPRGSKYRDYKDFNGSKFEFSTGGCIHETILKHFPDLQGIVNLHLSDLSGMPMHCLENGFYHLQGFLGVASFGHTATKETILNHFRIDENEFLEMVAIMQNNESKTAKIKIYSYIDKNLIKRYKNEAKECLKFIKTL